MTVCVYIYSRVNVFQVHEEGLHELEQHVDAGLLQILQIIIPWKSSTIQYKVRHYNIDLYT